MKDTRKAMKDTRKSEELFEALGELDDDIIAGAKHISGYGENVIVVKRTPLWKTIAGWSAAAACLAVLAVVGIFGIKYFGGKNTPPSSGTADSSRKTEISECMTYKPPTFPEDAKYVYTGDYSELEYIVPMEADRLVYTDIISLEESSDLIVIGEFTDDAHQFIDPVNGRRDPKDWRTAQSCNIFKIDKVVKGECFAGEKILIFQDGYVTNGILYSLSNLTPMLRGDKWVYFLQSYEGGYTPLGGSDGRYPVPGSEREFVLCDNVYGVFNMYEFRDSVYEEIKKRLPDWKYEIYFETEYPDNTEIFDGDYSELDFNLYDNSFYKELHSYDRILDEDSGCEFIVTGEFIDDPRQQFYQTENVYNGFYYNKFRVDKVYKGDIKAGQVVIIRQSGAVVNNVFYSHDNMTPMIKGDKWLYCMTKHNGICVPFRSANGRYPIPASGNTRLTQANDYYGVCDAQYANREVCERLLNELGIAVTKDFDGVVLSVMTDDKSLKVSAAVRNTTDKPIALLMPVTGEGSHTEIATEIKRGELSLIDIDTRDKAFSEAIDSLVIEPGGEYVQEMRFTVPLRDSVPGGYERGEYNGTARIRLLSDPYDELSETTNRFVEFTVTVDETADMSTAATKVYGYESGNAEWTMPEFPNVTFRCDGSDLIAASNVGVPEAPQAYTLCSGMPIFDVYLVDLNGDGKRELVSSAYYGSCIVDARIQAFDFAGGIGYTLADRGNYDQTLYIENGVLFARMSVYPGNEIVSEQPLSLDMMMTDDIVYVFNGTKSARWTMEEFPGTMFSADGDAVYAEKDGVKKALTDCERILGVLLFDNDGDGIREIICEVTDENGLRLTMSLTVYGSLMEYGGIR